MSPETKHALEKFAVLANWGTVGHPLAMERFWDFVILAYRGGERDISLDEFLEVVGSQTKDAKSERDVQKRKKELGAKMYMFGKYEDGMKLLSKFEGAAEV